MLFSMPNQGKLEIRSSKEFEEEPEIDEEIDGVVWQVFWNNQPLPWTTKTRLQATGIALGCQWGAFNVR